jgi:hypothetical protein
LSFGYVQMLLHSTNEHWDNITQAIHMIMRPFQVN